jgi:hypothetical protein
MQPQLPDTPGTCYLFPGVELHLTSPLYARARVYSVAGFIRLESANAAWDGSSVRIRSLATGLSEEAFLDKTGAFVQEVELQSDTDNPLEFAVCDGMGRERARVVVVVRAGSVSDGNASSLTLPARQARSPMLDPSWPRFTQLVQRCLKLAAEVADKTGRDLDELCDHIRAQERYAEQAYEERNPTLYHECNDNLEKYRGYLAQLLGETLPRPAPPRPSEDEARAAIYCFRAYLSSVWKQVREKQRPDLEVRLTEIAAQARGLNQRVKSDPLSVLREINRLGAEVKKVEDFLLNAHPF